MCVSSREEDGITANEQGSPEPLTYGSYLRVPELLELQTPLGHPDVHDEMLFILGQQAQELWFKQILHELRRIIGELLHGEILQATRLLGRVNKIMRALTRQTEVLETLPPSEFRRFRGSLGTASGFESEQFRELEVASGLRDNRYLKMIAKGFDLDGMLSRWPVSLADAFRVALRELSPTPLEALIEIYDAPHSYPGMCLLAEAITDYELGFQEWRFHHVQVVERVIGDHSPGTGGSAGSAYLAHTLSYRFFPELWQARNRLSALEQSL